MKRLVILVLLVAAPQASGQDGVVVHTSECHPAGSPTYPPGDRILFELVQPVDPEEATYYFPPCVDIRFEADTSGMPPLDHRWHLDGAHLANTGSEPTLVVSTRTLPAGPHLLELEVTNDHGSASFGYPFYVTDLQVSSLEAPEPVEAGAAPGTVVLRARHPAAEEWRWTFGDGTSTAWFAPCPRSVSTVVHTYEAPGEYDVAIEARNCRTTIRSARPTRITVPPDR